MGKRSKSLIPCLVLLTAFGGCAGTKKSQARETAETTVAVALLPVGLALIPVVSAWMVLEQMSHPLAAGGGGNRSADYAMQENGTTVFRSLADGQRLTDGVARHYLQQGRIAGQSVDTVRSDRPAVYATQENGTTVFRSLSTGQPLSQGMARHYLGRDGRQGISRGTGDNNEDSQSLRAG